MAGVEASGYRRVVVLGAGAIGSFYGALLSKRVDVLLLGRKEHVNAIKLKGLLIEGEVTGRFFPGASTHLTDVPEGALILLTTKAHDSERAIEDIGHLLRPGTTILVLQNGLGNEDIVRGLVDPDVEVVRGLASSGVELLHPGEVKVKLVGETVLPRTETGVCIKRLFDTCGLETRLTDQMDVEIWKKLTMNCVINPLTALFRVPNREIAAEPLKGVRRRIVFECMRVAREEGVILDPSLAEEVDDAAARYSNLSSMCQDVMKGRKTEIDFINGKVSELGRKHGVETPVNDVMTALIRFMEGRRWTWVG